ncbi:hypothetical protein JHK82_025297 [Glycine max]|nr:hypothetical protein JHK82_025297 [Glycine max]
MNTKRIILSPFTKEYRVFVTQSGIRLFLEEPSIIEGSAISIKECLYDMLAVNPDPYVRGWDDWLSSDRRIKDVLNSLEPLHD